MKPISKKLLLGLAASALFLSACSDSDSDSDEEETDESSESSEESSAGEAGSMLAAVQEADEIKCGTRDAMPGFALLEADGSRTGFDVDFCRAIAAAVLGDADKVDFVDLETPDRFTALQSGEIDVLVRNTTFTASRDGSERATFASVNFYDGQGMAVPANSSATNLEGLSDDATICVSAGTTTEVNVADKSDELGKSWVVQTFEDATEAVEAMNAGNCDGWSADGSQLVSLGPDVEAGVTIFEDAFSREPLAPAVLDGDTQWAQIVDWVVNTTIYAEELGLSQDNIDSADKSNVDVAKFFGETTDDDGNTVDFDPGLGLPQDFAYQIISQVGNYGDIYERNLEPLGMTREGSLNDLAINGNGGVHYGIPLK